MFRVEMNESANSMSLKVEGRFTGQDAGNTRTLLARPPDGMTLVVDLTEVTFIDPVGEEVLLFLGQLGAEFVAQTSYALDICERLHLRLAPGRTSDGETLGGPRTNGRRCKARALQPGNEKA